MSERREPRRRRPPPSRRPILTLALGLAAVVATFLYMLGVQSGRFGPLDRDAARRAQVTLEAPPGRERVIGPLTESDERQLEEQRRVVNELARRHVGATLTGSIQDLRVIQDILDRGVFERDQTFELQALGVALGDVMATQLGLDWVVLIDELGRSRALRLGETEVMIFPVTMISKRVERDVPFRVRELYQKTARTLARPNSGDV